MHAVRIAVRRDRRRRASRPGRSLSAKIAAARARRSRARSAARGCARAAGRARPRARSCRRRSRRRSSAPARWTPSSGSQAARLERGSRARSRPPPPRRPERPPPTTSDVAVRVHRVVARRPARRRAGPSRRAARRRARPRARPASRAASARAPIWTSAFGSSSSGRVDAARPVAVDAAEAAEHAVSHERRGERLALAPLVLDAVEAEPHGANSFVAVSRTTSNQRRQPCVCTQRSANGPFGLSRTKRNCAHSRVRERAGIGRVGDPRLGRRTRTRPRRARRTTGSGSAASVRDPGGAVLVDQRAGREAVERERRVQLVRLAVRDRPREHPARSPASP